MKSITLFIILLFTLADLSAQTDWKYQVTQFVDDAGSPTPAVNSHYNWSEQTDLRQGIRINLKPDKLVNIYVEAGNSTIKFTHANGDPSNNNKLRHLSVSIDGGSYQTIYNGGTFNYQTTVTWNAGSAFSNISNGHTLTVKYKRHIAGIPYTRYRDYDIKVVPPSDEWHKDQYKNSLRVWKSDYANAKPFLLSVGLDAHNILADQYLRHNMKSLIDCMLNDPYNPHDFYILVYRYNPQDLRNNAAVFGSAMTYVSDVGYGGKKIAVGGRSMGSLVARYALIKAEESGNPLPVTTYVSFDSPHQGASLSPEMQDFMKSVDWATGEFLRKSSDNPGAKIMLKYNPYNSSGSMHDAFYGELNTLNGNGFPHLTHNTGIAFANTSPNPNTGDWLTMEVAGIPAVTFTMTDEDKRPGSWMPRPDIDGFAGGVIVVNHTKDPTFLTYKSALAIDDNDNNPANDLANSRFDVHLTALTTSFHDDFPDEIATEIADEIIAADRLLFQNVAIEGEGEYKARTEIQAGNNVRTDRVTGDVVVEYQADITFRSGYKIRLRPGFSVENGTSFLGKIQPIASSDCSPYQLTEAGDYRQKYGAREEPEESLLTPISDYKNGLYVYPNPVFDELTIEYSLEKGGRVNMRLINNQGQVVRTLVDATEVLSGKHKAQINIKDLPQGIYLIQLNINDQQITQKILKTN